MAGNRVIVIATKSNPIFRLDGNAEEIGSRALQAESKETLVCDLQDLTVLIGLGANFLFGWWWGDPVTALGFIPFLVKEGWEGYIGEDEDDG